MAKKKKTEEPAAEGEGQKKEKGKKGAMLPALIVAIAVLAGGAMAGGVIGGGDASEAAEMAEPEPTETAPPQLGAITELDALTLNLSDGHFLKVGVAIEWSPDVVEELPTAPVYDTMIALFGPQTRDELSPVSARDRAKDDLLEDLAEIYGEGIVRLYFTEFVMQ